MPYGKGRYFQKKKKIPAKDPLSGKGWKTSDPQDGKRWSELLIYMQ